jgi:hypothetical protein
MSLQVSGCSNPFAFSAHSLNSRLCSLLCSIQWSNNIFNFFLSALLTPDLNFPFFPYEVTLPDRQTFGPSERQRITKPVTLKLHYLFPKFPRNPMPVGLRIQDFCVVFFKANLSSFPAPSPRKPLALPDPSLLSRPRLPRLSLLLPYADCSRDNL